MVLPQHETKKPKYARWVFLSGHISKTNQRTKHVESLKTRRLDEGSNPSDSTIKDSVLFENLYLQVVTESFLFIFVSTYSFIF